MEEASVLICGSTLIVNSTEERRSCQVSAGEIPDIITKRLPNIRHTTLGSAMSSSVFIATKLGVLNYCLVGY